ncbi:MAG: PCMD domain-containing protein [Bacteroidales bacterium]|nr:PCMD domain-containing protein [Bacteroidales bacterium]
MRRTILFLTVITAFFSTSRLLAQEDIVRNINAYGTFDNWSIRSVKESDIIGGQTKRLYEFYGNQETVHTREPLVKPDCYPWRTNNVLAIVAGVVKTNTTVFPEKRGDGYCARIETHIEEVKALGINMEVVCQGALLIGDLAEPIRSTRDPMAKVLYGIPFSGRPSALVFDYKADVGHTVIRGTGFSRLKTLDYVDYPEISIVLQKRWEDESGNVHALRVGTGHIYVTENVDEWCDGYRLEVKYGDITSDPSFKEYMGLNNHPDRAYHTINSKGDNVVVSEDGWADADVQPNFLIIKFLSSCSQAFYGGVGNTLWIDNVRLEM